MDDDKARLIVEWGREWLDLTKVSPTLFQEYLVKYGVPRQFELSMPDKDIVYKAVQETVKED